MLEYTRAAINKTVADLKKFNFIFNIVIQLLYVFYLIYAIFAPAGSLWVNVVLSVVSVGYLVFYTVTYDDGRENRRIRIITRRWYKWFKISLRAFTLGTMIYGIYAASTHLTVISLTFVAFMIVGWMLQVIFELVVMFAESKLQFLYEGIKADFENITKPARVAKDVIMKIAGKEPEPKPEPTKHRLILNEHVAFLRAERARKKEERKAEKKLKKQQKREIKEKE